MQKIKKNDEVIVLTGKDKGKRGKVLRVVEQGSKLVVTNVNLVKKHQKPNPQRNQQGGIIEREAAIDISNVAIFNPLANKADKVRFKVLDDGKKARVFKSSNELIDI